MWRLKHNPLDLDVCHPAVFYLSKKISNYTTLRAIEGTGTFCPTAGVGAAAGGTGTGAGAGAGDEAAAGAFFSLGAGISFFAADIKRDEGERGQ